MRSLFLSSVVLVFYACGDARVMVSNDPAPPADGGVAPEGGGLASKDGGLASKDGGLAPEDGGPLGELRFESLTPPRGGRFFAVAASPSTLLVRAHGRYLRSDDGGVTWRSQSGPSGCGGTPWLVAAGDDFFTACGDAVHASGDGGETWSRVEGVGGFDAPEPATDGTELYWIAEPGTVMRWNAGTRAVEAVPGTTALGFPGHVATLGALGTDGLILYGASTRGSGWIDASAAAPAWVETNLPGYESIRFAFGGGEGYAITRASVLRRMPDHSFAEVGTAMPTGAQDALLRAGRLLVTSSLGVIVSSDGGVTWSTELPVRFDNRSGLGARGDDLFAASREGLWARHGIETWREIALHSHQVQRILPVGDVLITFGLPNNAALRRGRAGAAWEAIDLGEHQELTAVGDLLFAIRGRAIYRSNDMGRSFAAVPELPGPISYITELDSALLALLDRSFYESTDGGASFTALGAVPANAYQAKALLRVGDTLLYWDGPALYRSRDRMRTWEPLAQPPIFASRVAAGDGVFAADHWGMLFRSTDLGDTWAEVALPAGVTRVAALESDGAVLFAAAHHADALTGAIYTTRDRGETWQALGSAMESFAERGLALALDGGVLYIGTEATGLWAAHLAGTTR